MTLPTNILYFISLKWPEILLWLFWSNCSDQYILVFCCGRMVVVEYFSPFLLILISTDKGKTENLSKKKKSTHTNQGLYASTCNYTNINPWNPQETNPAMSFCYKEKITLFLFFQIQGLGFIFKKRKDFVDFHLILISNSLFSLLPSKDFSCFLASRILWDRTTEQTKISKYHYCFQF